MELRDNPDIHIECNIEVEDKHGKCEDREPDLLYSITEVPPWYESIFLALQHFLSTYVATLSVPFVLAPAVCLGEDGVGRSELIGNTVFVCGIATVMQVLFGVRLPIVQTSTFALLTPTLSYLSLPELKCPTMVPPGTMYTGNETVIETGSDEHKAIWRSRLLQVEGSLMVASILEVFLGLTGAIGFFLRYIGPLCVAPTIALLGVSLFRAAASYAEKQWWIAIMTIFVMILFSQYLDGVSIPCLSYKKDKGCQITKYPLFKMFPVILAVFLAWLVCYILTITDVFASNPGGWGYESRTDIRLDVLRDSAWVRVPYPGQWGAPTVQVSLVLGILAGILASIVESVGDYYVCAKILGVPPPPKHAINRGIIMEGLSCILAAGLGAGNGTTSQSVNIGVIGITKVGSRRVVLYAAILLIISGAFGKFGGFFSTIPDPVIGGSFFIFFGLIIAVGISNLQHVDMNRSRNLFIFGFSFFFGLTLPEWVIQHPNAIDTGISDIDNIFKVLLSTNMFVCGVVAFILDNTIKGSRDLRGMSNMSGDTDMSNKDIIMSNRVYTFNTILPCIGGPTWTKYLPFCPKSDANMNIEPESTVENSKL